ncbi:MAG: restriction endonuclease subunit S [Bacteroidetes bacterium]|nr:restriction endonuclease subunit S [Bacteroidota bacterium]
MSSKAKTTDTNEEGKPALVPKLRFPEFRDAWEKKALETLGYFTGGGTPSRDKASYWTGDIPWISSSDLNEDSLSQINISRFITKQAVQESATKILPAKSILLVSRVGVGKLAVSTFPLCTSQDFTNFTTTDAETLTLFLAYLLKSNKETLLSFNQGTSIKGFTKDNIASLCLGFPSLPEQQKIADCLSSLDELIAAQARKVNALKTHKKGLMQQLFPREGETVPRLRFPEFQDDGEWEMKPLGSIASFSSGGTPSKDNPEYWNGTIPWVSASSMYDLVVEKADHYVAPLAIGNGTRIAKKGSILILVRGSMLFKRVPICVAGIDVAFNQDVKALDLDSSIKTGFLLYQLLAFQSRFSINETGIGAGKIELDHLKEFVLFFPNATEQQRIADCLSKLDEFITAETQKMDALKTHKKGLMQGLFPSTNTQTGIQ